MAKPFIAYDGYNSEVRIISGEGKAVGFERKNGQVQVSMQDENPKVLRPNAGWIKETDPIVKYLEEAQAEDRVVNYRIEVQRREGVDKQAPLAELMGEQDLAKAYKNTIRIFAGADHLVSSEAVTDPEQDTEGGRKSAIGMNKASQTQSSSAPSITLETLTKLRSVISNPDTLATLAALTGDDTEAITKFIKSSHKAQYADVVASVIRHLDNTGLNIPNLGTVVEGVLWVSDSVQTSLFNLGTSNRLNASHKQIRELVLNEVDASNIEQFGNKNMDTYKTVGASVLRKYSVVLDIISHDPPSKYLSLSADAPTANTSRPPQNAPANNAPVGNSSTPAPREEAPVQESEQGESGEVFDYPVQDHDKVKESVDTERSASEENIAAILDLASKISQDDYPKLSKYLNSKFGVSSFAKIPDVYLSEIISFFTSAGTPEEASELFKKAVLNFQ